VGGVLLFQAIFSVGETWGITPGQKLVGFSYGRVGFVLAM
jgi:hypothetical protein